jgi:hypothetical protein
MRHFMDCRNNHIRQYVGTRYSTDGAAHKMPLNLLEITVNIYLQKLAANSPQVLVKTPYGNLRPRAETLQLAINHLLGEINFRRSLQQVVIDAMFGIGVAKIALAEAGSVNIDGTAHTHGQPFFDCVSLDDLVIDMNATRTEELQYIGNRYRMDVEDALAFEGFDPRARQALKESAYEDDGAGFIDEQGTEKASDISSGGKSTDKKFMSCFYFWEIYIPKTSMLLTLSDNPNIPILRQRPWEGPETGPYRILAFHHVPDQVLPLPPVAMLMDMHEAANGLMRKLMRQASRQKTIGLVRTGAERDGERVVSAKDGDVLSSDDPGSFNEVSVGGIDQRNFAFLLQLKELYSWTAGNLDALGGLGAQSETLGQDELLTKSANDRVASMQEMTVEFTQDCVTELGKFLWYDPMIDLPLVKRSGGVDIPVRFSPELREGDFFDYNLKIEPHSLQRQTPGSRMQSLMSIVERFVVPLMPMLQQQGLSLDLRSFIRIISQYANLPELGEILISSTTPILPGQPIQAGMSGQEGPMKPASTTRHYERTSKSAGNTAGKTQDLINRMMTAPAGGMQPSNMGA